MRPSLNAAPSFSQFLNAFKVADKAKTHALFAETLTACASVTGSIDKYRLGSPRSEELNRVCSSGVGIEIFTINAAYEMTFSICYTYVLICSYLKRVR